MRKASGLSSVANGAQTMYCGLLLIMAVITVIALATALPEQLMPLIFEIGIENYINGCLALVLFGLFLNLVGSWMCTGVAGNPSVTKYAYLAALLFLVSSAVIGAKFVWMLPDWLDFGQAVPFWLGCLAFLSFERGMANWINRDDLARGSTRVQIFVFLVGLLPLALTVYSEVDPMGFIENVVIVPEVSLGLLILTLVALAFFGKTVLYLSKAVRERVSDGSVG